MTAHLAFEVAGERYAVPVESVREVTRIDAPTPVPGAPSAVLGVQNLRGRIVPVLDFSALVGLDGTVIPEWAVIVEDGAVHAGLAVEAVRGVEDVPQRREPADSPTLANAAVSDGQLVGVVDLQALLSTLAERRDAG